MTELNRFHYFTNFDVCWKLRCFLTITYFLLSEDLFKKTAAKLPNCADPIKPLFMKFMDPEYGDSLEAQAERVPGVFPHFADIYEFSNKSFDFKVYRVDMNELYSVIMMQMGTYARLEPYGVVRLKWFVANIPGKNLRFGKSRWNGTVLKEFEPIVLRNRFDYNALWVYKQVDDDLKIEEPIEDPGAFALQSYYDYLCSKPDFEVLFIKKEDGQQIYEDIHAAKRLVF